MNTPNFRTEVNIDKHQHQFDLKDKIIHFGSCFATNIGNRMATEGFDSLVNPFGVLYNPISIKNALLDVINRKEYQLEDLFEQNGKYCSYQHHSIFNHEDPNVCLKQINNSIEKAHHQLKEAKLLTITFGTAWVYSLINSGDVVANCHRTPANEFERFRLTIDDIVNQYQELLKSILAFNPELKVIFTVSPIRHWKDGAHENQISKSTLLLAAEHISFGFKEASYFPSYEIMMDDLRDYRFYKEDMIHPSEVAIDYIWSKFQDVALKENEVRKELIKMNQFLSHRVTDRNHPSYLKKLDQMKDQLQKLSSEITEDKLIELGTKLELS